MKHEGILTDSCFFSSIKRETVNISVGVFSLSKTSWSKFKFPNFSFVVLGGFGHGFTRGKKIKCLSLSLFLNETYKLMVQVDVDHLTILMPIRFTISQIA